MLSHSQLCGGSCNLYTGIGGQYSDFSVLFYQSSTTNLPCQIAGSKPNGPTSSFSFTYSYYTWVLGSQGVAIPAVPPKCSFDACMRDTGDMVNLCNMGPFSYD